MSVLLGIDTGGTYTDAALFDKRKGITGSAKALTTKHDLSIGIREALHAVMPRSPEEIGLVSLSTTLATNAVVEGQGSPICLILIGYDPALMNDIGIEEIVPQTAIVYIRGGHTSVGEEIAPLDLVHAEKAIRAIAPEVDAFAVSGYFGVRNPEHEIEIRKLIRGTTGRPVTCGHELTTQLHAPRRAVTVAMNARLIPLLDELIQTVRRMLTEQGIDAPLMVVKGDGSLVDADMALERPVETILSGPAASVVGASYLADVDDAIVVDMGGTTTDIASMVNGHPILNPKGAHIDGWQIMIEAIDARTTGLGGDSEIRLDDGRTLCAGPQRVVPLCLLADPYPEILPRLQDQVRLQQTDPDVDQKLLGRFLLRQRQSVQGRYRLTDTQQTVWEKLDAGPQSLFKLLSDAVYPPVLMRGLDDLISRGLAVISAFTPTDALHVLGRYGRWSPSAAEEGAKLWADRLGMDRNAFCGAVVQQVELQMGRAIVDSALAEEHRSLKVGRDHVGRFLIDRALSAGSSPLPNPSSDRDPGSPLSICLQLNRSLVAIGAPVENYLPNVAGKLDADLHIPAHAEIDNAVGAAVAGVVQSVRVLIQSVGEGEALKVHLPFGVRTYGRLEDAVACAEKEAGSIAEEKARQAGAEDIEVQIERRDRIVAAQEGVVDDIYIDTEIVATAVGQPHLK